MRDHLHEALTICALADDYTTICILHDTGHNFSCRCRVGIDEHHQSSGGV